MELPSLGLEEKVKKDSVISTIASAGIQGLVRVHLGI